MVVENRIAYLRKMVYFEAKATVTVSSNPSTGVEKVKVVVDPNLKIPAARQNFALQMFDALESACSMYRVADRGHKHSPESGGRSEVHFFITPRHEMNTAAKEFVPAARRERLSLQGDWRSLPADAWDSIYSRFECSRDAAPHTVETMCFADLGMEFDSRQFDRVLDSCSRLLNDVQQLQALLCSEDFNAFPVDTTDDLRGRATALLAHVESLKCKLPTRVENLEHMRAVERIADQIPLAMGTRDELIDDIKRSIETQRR